jgi:uncharacterized protein with PIN domain
VNQFDFVFYYIMSVEITHHRACMRVLIANNRSIRYKTACKSISMGIFVNTKTNECKNFDTGSNWVLYPPYFTPENMHCVYCAKVLDPGVIITQRAQRIRIAEFHGYACVKCHELIWKGGGVLCDDTIQLPIVCHDAKMTAAHAIVLCLHRIGVCRDIRRVILKMWLDAHACKC